MLQRLSFGVLILAGAFTVAQADVYRWVDDKGEPHYSDQWMPGAVVVKTTKAHPPGFDSGQRAPEQKGLTAANARTSEKLGDEDNARAVQQDVARRKDAVCKQARDQYTRAIASRRIFKNDKNGERDYMSDAEADAYRAQIRKTVQDNCGSVPQFDPNAPIPEPQPVEPKPLPEPKVNPAAATSQ
jgi:hypothetical protein